MTAASGKNHKGLLRFDLVDEDGWEWIVLSLSPDANASASASDHDYDHDCDCSETAKHNPRRQLVQLDLSPATKLKVNGSYNRFSWTSDGIRDTDDKKVYYTLDGDREGWAGEGVVSDIELMTWGKAK
ncbi:MAG: hypothetical protein CYPHOPRED_005000 [Cyphobasidiales sp. Tagirdzhanova-0007]|nr:MAG: hypothetical protein CYPHOPRED_005000 [Cyphobasidiales sp. Tagirdzhanova-0007]